MSDVMSENVAKLIAILTTFSRTGHNWADVDCAGNMDVPALMRTGHYQLDGTFTDWQSRIDRRSPAPGSNLLKSRYATQVPDSACRRADVADL